MLFDSSDVTQIIMVSYFRPNDFRRSVKSILNNTKCAFHLTIIDNSCGGLDSELDIVEANPHITVRRNDKNYGKGASFNMWYDTIMTGCKLSYFISIDSDVRVPTGWLGRLKIAYQTVSYHEKPGIIAPVIMSNKTDTIQRQIKIGKLSMHNLGEFAPTTYHAGLYRNRYIAGPLFIIDTAFFKNVGGYYDGQLYGADDGKLCAAATRQNRFVGIDGNVHVMHMNKDSTQGYDEWKHRNITKDVDHKGYWDQSDTQDSNDR